MENIVLIGPVYPYKGGIAHYTSLLYRALAKEYNMELISYKMQYPGFLYKKEQTDFANDFFRIENTEYLIHTANPFNIIRVGKKIRKRQPDLIIMQWWHPYFAPCCWILEKILGRKIRKIFICHNVFPHERFPLDKFLTKLVLKNGDAFIVHSKSDGEALLTIKQKADIQYNPHPTYNVFKMKNLTKEQARKKMHILYEKKVLLFFGYVRAYKGLKYLLRAMPAIKEKFPETILLAAGAFGSDKEDYLNIIKDEGIMDCVEVVDQYIPDHEVEKYFAACDLAVLPYESATQSGIAQIAFGFEKPVIATNVGGLPDVVKDGKTGYVVEPGNQVALAEAVIQYFKENKEREFVENIKKAAYQFSWDRMVETIEKLQ